MRHKGTATQGKRGTKGTRTAAKRKTIRKTRVGVRVGRIVPNFSLPSNTGETVSLKDLRGQNVLLYFYPRNHTPGCTLEACDFRDHKREFAKRNTVVIGISPDSVKSHKKFRKDYKLPFLLLSDSNYKVARMFGVYRQKTLYGKKVWGIERSTFLIDPGGRLLAALRKVNVEGHAEEMLRLLDSPH